MTSISLQNRERLEVLSGYGIINRGLFPIADADPEAAPIWLFCSPPKSFQPRAGKFNVGLTMSERSHLADYGFPFVEQCNQMDLLLVPSQWCKAVFEQNGITTPIEVVSLGHDHERWYTPVRESKNRRALIIHRGRDRSDSAAVLTRFFTEIDELDCTPPKETLEQSKRWELLTRGKVSDERLAQAYAKADVFFKWGREGYCYPLLQAMSAGALVMTNCGHLPYLKPDENCLVFTSVPQLLKQLEQVRKQPLTELKQAGQETAASLTWERSRQDVLAAIYRHV